LFPEIPTIIKPFAWVTNCMVFNLFKLPEKIINFMIVCKPDKPPSNNTITPFIYPLASVCIINFENIYTQQNETIIYSINEE
jgi:hypothetical protein